MRKKILLNLGIIGGLIFLVAVAGTGAFFQDLETSQANITSAGLLDLLVNGQKDPTGIVVIDDLKPSIPQFSHKTVQTDNPAKIYLHLKDFVATQGAQTEPEIAEETVSGPRSDIQTVTDYDLTVGESSIISLTDATTLADAFSCWIPLGEIPATTPVPVEQSFHMRSNTTNWAQGDVLTFTEEFMALQVNDPAVPDTGTGRGWNPETKKCENVAATPTPTPSATPVVSSSPSPTPSSEPFADAVPAVDGQFGHCCDVNNLSSDPSVAAANITGPPDSPPNFNFIQLSDTTVLTAKFVDNKAVDDPGADIRIHIYDALFPQQLRFL